MALYRHDETDRSGGAVHMSQTPRGAVAGGGGGGALAGKSALITGGGRGIGAAIAGALSTAGARVALVGRTEATLKETADTLPGEAIVVAADLGEPAAPRWVVDRVAATFDGIDVLVNNAGIANGSASDELTAEAIDAVLALNVRAPLLLAGATAAGMARNGGGSIITISSALSQLGNTHSSVYAASKGAVDAATRALAAEWGASNVRVNAVRPGVTRSEMADAIVANDAIRTHYLKHVPLARVGETDNIAQAVLFLASDAAAYVTGQTIDVDGGWATTAPSIFAST
jgi:NAD(P)-dependent dehydrogenase (short-subunit alcohol dehydrogenase family)